MQFKKSKFCTNFNQIGSITLGQKLVFIYKFTPVHHQQRKNISFLKIDISRNHKSQKCCQNILKSTKLYIFLHFAEGGRWSTQSTPIVIFLNSLLSTSIFRKCLNR